LLILNAGSKLYLDALITLVLESYGSPRDRISAWVSLHAKVYAYFPSELTLPLAQHLMQKLKQASEFY
jgi:hypothetical protein